MGKVAKVIELVGESSSGWQEAMEDAVQEAHKTVDNITGVEVTNWTATVENGKVNEYKVDVKIAFGVDSDRR
ncbi:MAG: dodecin family protein [Firmicutes bacterium]|jgi:hypothetical protein|nr:dodecin family protein [Bacillota bacterium]MCL5064770.1 dodecin family protein [Bacillota bacterium]